MRRIRMVNEDEYDAFTSWRYVINFWHTRRSKIKRGYRRRERHLQRALDYRYNYGW